jgi:hypothetical protein
MLRGAVAMFLAVLCQASATLPIAGGVADPALTRLLTPASVAKGTYVVYRSDRPLRDVVAELSARDPNPPVGAWKPERRDALEAFEAASRAHRFRIAELYRGVHPVVARGSLMRGGQRTAYTLISPYPDASLTRLEPGTMIIVFHIPF